MAYTVKQVAAMSGVSVRTLHFYDETGLLKPAYLGANGYRYYEERQLLTLQQILFYRELGFELKQIKRILGRRGFEIIAALESHRKVLEQNLTRTRQLVETIDKTIQHLKGSKRMKTEEMFTGFSIGAGQDRFDERITLGGEPYDCKVSAKDTGGAMCVFELTGRGGGPRHFHHHEDEWIYVITGDFEFEVGEKRFRAGAGECVFVPRQVAHAWASVNAQPGKVINVYQPAGKMEDFFHAVAKFRAPPIHEVLSIAEMGQLFEAHGMCLLGPPLHWTAEAHLPVITGILSRHKEFSQVKVELDRTGEGCFKFSGRVSTADDLKKLEAEVTNTKPPGNILYAVRVIG
ncbi:MAG: MerR family transcriptional regulator [Verrucomicrobiota bacterium]